MRRKAKTHRRPAWCLVATGLCLIVAGCSGRQVYDAGLGWRQNECNRMVDAAERARCLETANKDYDGYSREKSRDTGNP